MAAIHKNFTWILSGRLVYTACQGGILIALARLEDTVAVGIFGLALAITGPVFAFSEMSLRSMAAADVTTKFGYESYFWLRVFSGLTSIIVVLGVAASFSDTWRVFLVIALVGLAKLFETVSDICYGAFQQLEQMHHIGVSLILRGILMVITVVGLIYFTHSLPLAFLGYAVCFLCTLVLYDLRVLCELVDSVSLRLSSLKLSDCWALFYLALPLSLVAFLKSLEPNLPRYFIEWWHGGSDLGIFSALAYLLVATAMISTALQQASIPVLARRFNKDPNRFVALLARLLAVGLALGVVGTLGCVLVGRPVLSLLYGDTYAAHNAVLVLLMVGAASRFARAFLTAAMFSTDTIRALPLIYLATALMACVSSYLLIPHYGLVGAAWSTILTSWASFLLSLLVVGFKVHSALARD